MSSLLIHNLSQRTRDSLGRRAAAHGRSIEDEAKAVLDEAASREGAEPAQSPSEDEFKRKLDKVQALVKARVGDKSLVEALFTKRRWEVACEMADADGLPRPPHPSSGE
jgi:plasmid stability protein